ncbi:hypothetical protein [Thalassotalea ganghwensis]
MAYYNIFGTINTLFIFISLLGIYAQLKTIYKRKLQVLGNNGHTALLSVNQFSVSFFAYLAFFIYGYSIAPFNHYIVWPRLIAALLVFLIIWEIWKDRKSLLTLSVFILTLLSLIVSLIGLVLADVHTDHGKNISTIIILVVSAFIAQGYFHQAKLILKAGETGAVNLKMSQFIFLMDLSTLAFALSMGFAQGWPLIILATTSAITKIVMMYLFYWVKVSPLASQRRRQVNV